ncbi:hypothetical protein KP509_30G015100 [Ceratopteris richardii]|uniref:Uncharacterized protein n=1 Tax=Ceratopteris richardii TaxID=49495 RepID=A0A8T2R186_CERRI|nr:hypothetical protein KP509_30G015100 [Ceratopteris richardii]KAH7289701.1 hypothetical protein KP509_30G015100 [Ceratopteris richardii]
MALFQRASKGKGDAGKDALENKHKSESNIGEKMWKKVSQEYRLLEYHACPEYMKDNEFILSYYRVEFSVQQALSSLFKLHNETLNVWTHLLGFLLFLVLTVFTAYELGELPAFSRCIHGLEYNQSEHCILQSMKVDVRNMMAPMLTRTPRWPFFVFMCGSMFCLLASAVCHLLTCHSEQLAVFLMRVDYAGIGTMIATSFYPPIYYVFQCDPFWQMIYLGTISCMGIITLWVLFAPSLQNGKYRPFRALLFMSMGAFGVIPGIHAAMEHWNEPLCGRMLGYEALMAGCYVLGTLIYVARIPERWKPGLFDLAGHSHSVFHILVIAGAYAHYRAALLFLEWRDSKSCT